MLISPEKAQVAEAAKQRATSYEQDDALDAPVEQGRMRL